MAKQTEEREPAQEQGKAKEPPRPAMVHLRDRAGNVQLQFLAREVRMSNGRIGAIKTGVATVRLTAGAGEIAVWNERSDEGPTAMITSEGYRKCNQIAGVTVHTPSAIEIAKLGKVANPYVETSESTGAFRAGWVRKVAIAPTPLGNMAICDRTTYLSLVEYLLEDMIGIAKRNPCAALWGVRDVDPGLLIAEAVAEVNADIENRAKENRQDWLRKFAASPEDLKRAQKKIEQRCWAFLEVEQITGQGIWFDRTSEAVATVMGTYVRTGKFGIRKLEAIAYRNVLSDHPLMPKKKISPDRLFPIKSMGKDYRGNDKEVVSDWWTEVTVFFHEAVEGQAEIEKVLRDYEAGLRTAANVTIDRGDEKPERVSHRDDVGEGEADEATKEEREDKGRSERLVDEGEPAPAAQSKRAATVPDPIAGLIAQLRTTEEIAGKAIVEKILGKFPTVKADRSKASADDLRAYGRALEAAINARDNAR